MNGRQFAKYLARDLACPCGCINREDTYVPQHRVNRGMGGSKLLDRPSNILVMCSQTNGQIESDPEMATMARGFGWKLSSWEVPEEASFYDIRTDTLNLIDNDFNRTNLRKEGP